MNLLTMAELACIAGLIGQPVPTENLKFVLEVPEDYIGFYSPGLKIASVPPDYETRTNPKNIHVHEAVHYILDMNGMADDWRAENWAIWSARKFDTWCRDKS